CQECRQPESRSLALSTKQTIRPAALSAPLLSIPLVGDPYPLAYPSSHQSGASTTTDRQRSEHRSKGRPQKQSSLRYPYSFPLLPCIYPGIKLTHSVPQPMK